jgi:TfoX/Sxy family transcriptional regulator of competence genes
MAYDEALAQRVREAFAREPGLTEREMFGGIGFMLRGNMACGVHGDRLIVRVGPQAGQAAMQRPHVLPFDITGRPMKGWVMVTAEGCQDEEAFADWVREGIAFARSLPAK